MEKAKQIQDDPRAAYRAGKALAEKELWKFGEAHPGLDITTIIPPFIYGPFAEGFDIPTPNFSALSTDVYIYRLITPGGGFPATPKYTDVRDVAKTHVAALESPLSSEPGIGRKRLLIGSLEPFDYNKFFELMKQKRPELTERLTKTAVPQVPAAAQIFNFDAERLETVLRIKKGEYRSFESTMLDTVDSILGFETEWIAKGYRVEVPLTPSAGL